MSENARPRSAQRLGETLGPAGERLAAEHLLRLGYEILERNYRTRWGELDIVASRDGTLAFCEVKTRRAGGRAGGPFEAVSRDKQQRVRRMANSWLVDRRDRPFAPTIRFDAIGITLDGGGRLVSLEHLEGAF
ncbi:MAG: YraN family protein [Solirubrobacteraceae bacterium]